MVQPKRTLPNVAGGPGHLMKLLKLSKLLRLLKPLRQLRLLNLLRLLLRLLMLRSAAKAHATKLGLRTWLPDLWLADVAARPLP